MIYTLSMIWRQIILLGRSFGMSEKALAVVLKLLELGFPRLPYGPIFLEEVRKFFALLLLCRQGTKSKCHPSVRCTYD